MRRFGVFAVALALWIGSEGLVYGQVPPAEAQEQAAPTTDRDDAGEWGWLGLIGLAGLLGLRGRGGRDRVAVNR